MPHLIRNIIFSLANTYPISGMELLLKPKTLYNEQSLYKRDYTHPVPHYTLDKVSFSYNAPSALTNHTKYVPSPPSCRKPIVMEPIIPGTLPNFTREIQQINGGRYRLRSKSAFDVAGTSANLWMAAYDEERNMKRLYGTSRRRHNTSAVFRSPLLYMKIVPTTLQ